MKTNPEFATVRKVKIALTTEPLKFIWLIFEHIKCLSCLDSALALDGIGSLIENELKLLIEKCLADYAEKEQEKNENSPWFTSYVRNAPKTKRHKILWKLALRRKNAIFDKKIRRKII